MRGHEAIIALRLKGKKPGFVFLNDWDCETNWTEHGDHATVCIATDDPDTADLRFLKDLRVSISSHSESRAKAFFARCIENEVEAVAAMHVKPEQKPWAQDGWAEVWNGRNP